MRKKFLIIIGLLGAIIVGLYFFYTYKTSLTTMKVCYPPLYEECFLVKCLSGKIIPSLGGAPSCSDGSKPASEGIK